MSTLKRFPILLAGTALTVLAACTNPPHLDSSPDPNKNTKQGALLGGILGAGVGALVSDDKAKGAAIGGVIGAAGGAVTGSVLDKQEAELRESLGNEDVVITNTGDRLIVTLPQDILFEVDSAVVNPGLRTDLLKVANNLQQYPDSSVQIVGHTDNSGSAEHNQDLSERRADAVADVLLDGGVGFNRIQTFGRGENQPVASNLTEEGKAQNRRVEIVILPNQA